MVPFVEVVVSEFCECLLTLLGLSLLSPLLGPPLGPLLLLPRLLPCVERDRNEATVEAKAAGQSL